MAKKGAVHRFNSIKKASENVPTIPSPNPTKNPKLISKETCRSSRVRMNPNKTRNAPLALNQELGSVEEKGEVEGSKAEE
jgi:hypothetical protein